MNYDTENLLKIKEELNRTSDELNKKILEFEEYLKKLSMGVPVWINITPTTALGYQKFEGEWAIVIRYDEFGKEKVTVLYRSTRTLRLYGYKHLHELLPALEKAADSLLTRMKKELEE